VTQRERQHIELLQIINVDPDMPALASDIAIDGDEWDAECRNCKLIFTYWLTNNAAVRLGLCREVSISKMVFDPYPDKDNRGPLDCGTTVIG
jgi:hypothetical protein